MKRFIAYLLTLSILLFVTSCGGGGGDGNGTGDNGGGSGTTPKVGDSTVDPVTGMEFLYVPPGSFTMGDEWGWPGGWAVDEVPLHTVTISKGFYLGKFEVTQAQWEQIMGYNNSRFLGANKPVETTTWEAMQDFIAALNTANGNDGCSRGEPGCYYLPTEAQWEYAAKGGPPGTATMTQYAGSDDWWDVASLWAHCDCETQPVGSKAPNELGIYDMTGNVWEFVQDWYGPYSADDVTDPTGPATGDQRVLRGGSWGAIEENLRISDRYHDGQRYPADYSGFRIAHE